jgi:hypothetical protein
LLLKDNQNYDQENIAKCRKTVPDVCTKNNFFFNFQDSISEVVDCACSSNVEIEIPDINEDAVFLFDDNIPSIPTRLSTGGDINYIPEDELQTRVRRNQLLRLISDPKSYYTAFLGPPQPTATRCHDNEDAVMAADDSKEFDLGSAGGFCSSRQIGE